jgi:hypothetical protein
LLLGLLTRLLLKLAALSGHGGLTDLDNLGRTIWYIGRLQRKLAHSLIGQKYLRVQIFRLLLKQMEHFGHGVQILLASLVLTTLPIVLAQYKLALSLIGNKSLPDKATH